MVGLIVSKRGLHQGNPISPYLFIIAAEGLLAIIQNRESRELVHGCKIAPNELKASHLFFTDDSYLFF